METAQPLAADLDGGGPLTGSITMYADDAVGDLTSVTDPVSRVTSYTYDALNNVTRVTAPDPDGGSPLTNLVTNYAYDAAGELLTRH